MGEGGGGVRGECVRMRSVWLPSWQRAQRASPAPQRPFLPPCRRRRPCTLVMRSSRSFCCRLGSTLLLKELSPPAPAQQGQGGRACTPRVTPGLKLGPPQHQPSSLVRIMCRWSQCLELSFPATLATPLQLPYDAIMTHHAPPPPLPPRLSHPPPSLRPALDALRPMSPRSLAASSALTRSWALATSSCRVQACEDVRVRVLECACTLLCVRACVCAYARVCVAGGWVGGKELAGAHHSPPHTVMGLHGAGHAPVGPALLHCRSGTFRIAVPAP